MTLCVHVQGKHHLWAFSFEGDPEHLEDWRADGLWVDPVVESIEIPDALLEEQ